MKKTTFFTTIACLALSVQTAWAAAVMPNTPQVCQNPATWQHSAGNAVIATPARIKTMNKAMLSDTMCDLAAYPATITGATLTRYIKHYTMDYDLYVGGSYLGQSRGNALLADAKANIPASTTVKYGIVTARSDLRSFPTLQRAFTTPGGVNFDQWQETAVDPGEPALILHKNGKGNFVFVQLQSYRGWLPTNRVAVTDRNTFLNYVQPKDFAVVTGRLLRVSGAGSSSWLFQMGSRIPLSPQGRLILPLRNTQGYLNKVEMPAPWGPNLHKGYLPYTANNTVAMAFKHLGSVYGWGGMNNSVDCSAFAQDVYKTMGLQLPRNGDEQENAWKGANLKGLSWNERDGVIRKLPLGSLLFTPYHVMMYLGEYQGRPYMIHSASSYGAKAAGGGTYRNNIMQNVVSDIYLPGASGTSLLMQMTKANIYK